MGLGFGFRIWDAICGLSLKERKREKILPNFLLIFSLIREKIRENFLKGGKGGAGRKR